jgi:uncharacterized protein (DUF1800 family)
MTDRSVDTDERRNRNGRGKGAYADFLPLQTARREELPLRPLDAPDAPDAQPVPAPDGRSPLRPSGAGTEGRRKLLVGLAATGTVLTAMVGVAGKLLLDRRGSGKPRHGTLSPADAGGFGSREESYTAAETVAAVDPQASTLYNTAGEAAAATQVTTPTILATGDPVIHLLRRTTFGPTPELVEEVHTKGIDGWLAEQLAPDSIPDPAGEAAWALYPRASMNPQQVRGAVEKYHWDAMADYSRATFARQIWSSRQLYEVMVDFWGNHLNVSLSAGPSWDVGVSYQNDVIRQHAMGSFTDMLLAANSHPGMLRYLDNTDSKKEAVNENLGRELLELHTVGVGSRYTEDDVRNSAYILTGRTEYRESDGPEREGTFFYDAAKHWTGPVQVLGFQHPNDSGAGGFDVGEEYLRFLASHPSTARTIARKLAVRFVADNPPQTLVDRLAKEFRASGTSVVSTLDTLFRSGEFWAAVGQKTRRPLESIVAAARAVDVRPADNTTNFIQVTWSRLSDMGHRPLGWFAPDGYPDVQPAWRSASGLLRTWNAQKGIVQGWDKGVSFVQPKDLVGDRPHGTVGEYIDGLCDRFCMQTFLPEHRQALIDFVGVAPETPSNLGKMDDIVQHLAPIVMHSPYFALR